MACRNNGGGGSRAHLQVTSADSCRMRKIEGVGTVELVYVGGLLRMGGDSLILPACRSVEDGFTGKGNSDVVWSTSSGHTKPCFHIFVPGALHVQNHKPTLHQ